MKDFHIDIFEKMQNKRQRIIITATFPPPVHGSAVVSQQIKESRVFNEAFNCDYVNLSTSRKMDEIGKKNPVKIFRFFCSFLNLFWKLLTHKYDLGYLAITCHGIGFLKDAPFVLLCKFFCGKVVIHQHNKGMSNDVDRPIYRWLLPLVYKDAKVILLSWHLYPDIEKIVKKENVFICPNGIPNKLHDKIQSHQEEYSEKIVTILFLSNLIESKGIFILLEALKILVEKEIIFQCLIVGSEGDVSIQQLQQKGEEYKLTNKIHYLGSKYGEAKESILSKSDVLVFPTYYETFGLVNLEAMQHGLPVISTYEGGIPDVVQNGITGFLVPQKNAQALAEKLELLIQNPKLRLQMGEAGRKRFEENFTLAHFIQNFQQIILEIYQKSTKK